MDASRISKGWGRALLHGWARCRGCLGPIDGGTPGPVAGLCGRCWEGLAALAEERCPKCALAHGDGSACPAPAPWASGDALWEYHCGRPALGPLLVPGIKRGERGWRAALLERAGRAPLPDWAGTADLVCPAPTVWHRRWLRGFDLAEEAAQVFARRLGLPCRALLRKTGFGPAQASLPEARRRRLPAKAVQVRPGLSLAGAEVLLVDDVWTTGTTLLRCAQALERAGAGPVRVLALFRALARGR
jgi:predicted amidophosphoribosyltransferase